jgi:hypothetical protein
MSFRDFVTGNDVCAPSDGAGPSNAVGALVNSLLGSSYKTQEQLREVGIASPGLLLAYKSSCIHTSDLDCLCRRRSELRILCAAPRRPVWPAPRASTGYNPRSSSTGRCSWAELPRWSITYASPGKCISTAYSHDHRAHKGHGGSSQLQRARRDTLSMRSCMPDPQQQPQA